MRHIRKLGKWRAYSLPKWKIEGLCWRMLCVHVMILFKNWTCFVWLLLQLVFDLAKQGMMRKFSGSWKFEPMKASESGDLGHGERRAPDHDDPVVGSWVSFQQVVEPAVKPPWPLNNYIRGIAEKIVREMLGDLQRECQRLSDVQNNTTSASENVAQQSWLCFPTPIFYKLSRPHICGYRLTGSASFSGCRRLCQEKKRENLNADEFVSNMNLNCLFTNDQTSII